MASGRLGSGAVTGSYTAGSPGGSTSWNTIYPVPTNTYSVFNVSFTNTNATSVQIKLAVASTATPATNEQLEYNTTIVGYGVFERTGLVADTGKQICVSATTSGVNANVYGIETSTQ